MKKSLFYVILSLALLCACSKERTDSSSGTGDKYFVGFQAETSRTSLDELGSICWSEGDRISVFKSKENEKYKLVTPGGRKTGEFEKEEGGAVEAAYQCSYAIYPYDDSNAAVSEGVFKTTLPGLQRYEAASFGVGSNIMASATKDIADRHLYFKSACSVLKLSLYCSHNARITEVRFKGNNEEVVAGTCILSVSREEENLPGFAFDASASGKEIVLDCGDGVMLGKVPSEATPFMIVLPPVSFSKGFTVCVKDSEGNIFEKSTSKSVTFAQNIIQPMSVLPFNPVVSRINGTDILAESNVYGLITDTVTGAGIEGVPVSDGYKYVETDQNGVYQMTGDPKCRIVYYSIPSGYKTNVDAHHIPLFYSTMAIDLTHGNRFDFQLAPVSGNADNFALIGIGDPQCSGTSNSNRYSKETVSDIKNTVEGLISQGYSNDVYALTLGDIVYEAPGMWDTMKSTMSDVQVSTGYIPFYQTIGNHDHTGTAKSQYESVQNYINTFGPTDYSFNIGKVHVVCMDDSQYSWSASGKGGYTGGFTTEQWAWLQDDLSHVRDKADKMVILGVHIPFMAENEAYFRKSCHYADVMNALCEFNEAHIMAGHTHTHYNYVHSDYKTKNGTPVYEHIHGTACGSWWSCNLAQDGTPNSYTTYFIEGNTMKNWRWKGTNFDKDLQFRVYDGNQIYKDSKNYEYCWYRAQNPCGTTGDVAQGDADLQDSFVVNYWSGDDTYCTLELYVDGENRGTFKQVSNKFAWDVCIAAFFYSGVYNINIKQYTQPFPHYWYLKCPDGVKPTDTNWEIRATQTIPGSGEQNVYTSNKLQTDFTGFAKK